MITKTSKIIENCHAEDISEDIINATEPLILKNFANDWPLVIAGKKSPKHAAEHLSALYNDSPVNVCFGEAQTSGRVFYNEKMDGFNYQAAQANLNVVFDKILQHLHDAKPPTIYVASTEIDSCFPGLANENPIDLQQYKPLTSLWIGNKTTIAAHYDFPNSIAVNVVGKRRFTLFPPDQISNLYVGPMEFAPGGQDISLVDFSAPDFDKHPKFKLALDSAEIAELDAGDALFLPSMWWHHVEGLTPFNVLMTHWWRNSPAYMGRPNNALSMAMLSLRSLPIEQRQAWKAIFNHYIFDHQDEDVEHIPSSARGVLNQPLDELSARKLRADLLNKLKR